MHSSVNYGSVLQTYATERVFNKLDCDVQFVNYTRKNITDQAYADRMQNRLYINILKKATFHLFDGLINEVALKKVQNRAAPMRRFIENNVTLTQKKYDSFIELQNDVPEADIYCTGSDQVWNSIWNGGIEPPYFLEYVPEGKPRIAYAASIGREHIEEREEKILSNYLQKYSFISMREQTGVELLKKLGIESTLVLDPTLMLSKQEWMKVADPVNKRKRPYLLAYILNWTDKISKTARKIAKINNLEILRICKSKINWRASDGTKIIVVDSVGQMLSYFDQASCVITDSFHATAFALNFHKPFFVILPQRFSVRLKDLLSLTGTEKYIVNNHDTVNSLPVTDWNNVDKILEIQRSASLDFLRKALGIKD